MAFAFPTTFKKEAMKKKTKKHPKPKKRNPRDLNLINLEAAKKREARIKKRLTDYKNNYRFLLKFLEDIIDRLEARVTKLELQPAKRGRK